MSWNSLNGLNGLMCVHMAQCTKELNLLIWLGGEREGVKTPRGGGAPSNLRPKGAKP